MAVSPAFHRHDIACPTAVEWRRAPLWCPLNGHGRAAATRAEKKARWVPGRHRRSSDPVNGATCLRLGEQRRGVF